MARDALSSGDRIAAETYYQHAEHYFRIMNARNDGASGQQPSPRHRGNGHAAEWATGESQDDDGGSDAQPAEAATANTAPQAVPDDGSAQPEAASAGRRQPRGPGRRRGSRGRGDQPDSESPDDGDRTGGDETAGT